MGFLRDRAAQARPNVNAVLQEVRALFRALPEILPRRPTTLLQVAGGTGGHEITARVVAAFYPGLHMVERELVLFVNQATIHAAITVAAKDRETAEPVTFVGRSVPL